MIRIGLCGFTMSIPEYFETYRVLEVQQTFYEPPQRTTLLRWREQAGPRFEFTMKAWQLVTHRTTSSTYKRLRSPLTPGELADCGSFRPTAIVKRGWETSLACARLLRANAILFQCPASFRPEAESLANMRTFFRSIERPEGVRLLWEPRGPAWPEETVRALCNELDLVHVVDPFVNRTTTPDLTYWRLHGLGDHRRPYTDEEMKRLPRMIDPSAKTTYVMFNEIPRVADSRRFMALLRAPPLSGPGRTIPGRDRSRASGARRPSG